MNEAESSPTRRSVGIIDFHNHVMPGVDDGAESEAESHAALEWMHAEGVSIVIASPHVDASFANQGAVSAERLAELDIGWAALQRVAARIETLDVRRSAEVRLSSADPNVDDPRVRIDGGPFVLVEFAYFAIPPRSARLLGRLRDKGFFPVLAHPERYSGYEADMSIVREWRAAGAFLQLSGPSLLGHYGGSVERKARALLAMGGVDYMSSDYHARGEPRIAETHGYLSRHGARAAADRMMHENPRRMLVGETPLEVGVIDTTSFD